MTDDDANRGDVIVLLGVSTRVFEECLIPNGALIEAPVQIPSFPSTARDCHRSLPGRDIAAAVLSMDAFGRSLRAPLCRWILGRANGFLDDGLLRTTYLPHGPVLDGGVDAAGSALLLAALHAAPLVDEALAVAKRLEEGLSLRLRRRAEAELGFDDDDHMMVAALAMAATPDDGEAADSGCLLGQPATPLRTPLDLLLHASDESLADAETDPRRNRTDEGSANVSSSFLDVIRLARTDLASASALFADAIRFADADGHFAESQCEIDGRTSPKPYLFSHLTFILAADAIGALTRIPGSGYTGRGRR
ncbi:MAG: hypothetical protein ACR2OO_16945 [Thermomicrobiales bacterium]